MGSGDLGQRARLETAETRSRGQREGEGDLTAGGTRAAGDKDRSGVWSRAQVGKGEEANRRKEKRG